ncbi:hypothetical protein CMT41_13695 [Colwellia sp. MT41]|nr:hypothetical protein CMT41_13695 [Colwellia sp. MT41]
MIYISRPDSAVKLNEGRIPAHQDELIVISVITPLVGCDVTIYAITDGAQEGFYEDGGEFEDETGYDLFLPTSCTPLRKHTRYDTDGDGDWDTEDKLAGIIKYSRHPLKWK